VEDLGELLAPMDRLRLNWRSSLRGENPTVIICGCQSGDGESVAAAAFATSLALSGQKVLLLDATVEGCIAGMLKLKNSPGLRDYLSGLEQPSISYFIQNSSEFENLRLMAAGEAAYRQLGFRNLENIRNQLGDKDEVLVVAVSALDRALEKSLFVFELLRPGVRMLMTLSLHQTLMEKLRLVAATLGGQKDVCIFLFRAEQRDLDSGAGSGI
ncbi:MAG: hypothetical protein K2X27_25075, partial [Candidatus Obscuribacterales bacterium]|nr:hypothetical protein [Candidatus Obscuribacterales bacterium]